MQTMQPEERVLIVGETIDGELSAGTRDIGAQARRLGNVFGGLPSGILTGHGSADAAGQWSRSAAMAVTLLENEQFRHPNPAAAAACLAERIGAPPLAVCFPHTLRSCQAAASLAWRKAWPCVTGVEAVEIDGSRVLLRRGIVGGKITQTVAVPGRTVVLTLMPGALGRSPAGSAPESAANVEIQAAALPQLNTRVTGVRHEAPGDQSLEQARVVVSGGRGIGGPEGVERLAAVAAIFKAAAVGGSRGACDLGWIPHSRQIGETGRSVSPALYIACGISGASQHLAGMRGSQTILAVNTDPRAAILNAAHLAVIENEATFLPLLQKRYAETYLRGEKACESKT